MLKCNGAGSFVSAHARLSVSADLSGGVRVGLSGTSFVLSPQDAVAFATALLKAAGVNVAFENPLAGVIRRSMEP